MNTRTVAASALALLVLGGLTWITRLQHELAASRANERTIALRASNTEALHDTTRDAARDNARLARILGDSLRAYRKLVVQHEPVPDRVDSALGGRSAGAYAMRLAIAPLRLSGTRANGDSTDDSRTAFHLRQAPYTVDATVSRPAGGDSTSLVLGVVLDTIPLTTRVHCSPPGDGGIRSASIVATSPPWAVVRIGDVHQDPEVCNGSTPTARSSRRLLGWSPVTLSVGRQLGAGRTGWSVQLGTGLTLGAVR